MDAFRGDTDDVGWTITFSVEDTFVAKLCAFALVEPSVAKAKLDSLDISDPAVVKETVTASDTVGDGAAVEAVRRPTRPITDLTGVTADIVAGRSVVIESVVVAKAGAAPTSEARPAMPSLNKQES
jgi:hypothetical protein